MVLPASIIKNLEVYLPALVCSAILAAFTLMLWSCFQSFVWNWGISLLMHLCHLYGYFSRNSTGIAGLVQGLYRAEFN